MQLSKVDVYDASHLTYRMYHQAKSINPENPIQTASYLLLNSVFALMKGNKGIPTVFLYDTAGATKDRKEIDENYKSNRVFNPYVHELKTRMTRYLTSLGFPVVGIEGLEADDIAYYLSRNCLNPLKFISEDKDWYSYVIDNKELLRPIRDKQLAGGSLTTFNDLLMKVDPILSGYLPENNTKEDIDREVHKVWIQRKALLGDASDNVAKFKGVGKSNIVQLLVKYNKAGCDINKFTPKGVVEKRFKADHDRFLRNIQVLSYDRMQDMDIKDQLTFEFNPDIDIKAALLEIAKEINSSRITNNADKYAQRILDNHVPVVFNWK
ncbi:5'-3' exonuclease [Yersinia phage YerA41]|jgi:5'-3' exonuclease|nr:5'-3' exonuclease [Yersinia phage YerA41]